MARTKTIGKLERRYARALLIAVERELGTGSPGSGSQTPAQKVAEEFKVFAAAWDSEPILRDSLLNPMFEKGERAQALTKIAEGANLQSIVVRFLQVCFDRERLGIVSGISAAFEQEAQRAAGVVTIEVVTAQAISQDEQQMIERSMATRIRGELRFRWSTDTSLLGGMVMRYQGKVLDGSVSGRLAAIERRLADQLS